MIELWNAMATILETNVKTLRVEWFNETQDVFAERLSAIQIPGITEGKFAIVSQASVSRWETGGAVEAPNIMRLARLAGCTSDDIQLCFVNELKTTPPGLGDAAENVVFLPVMLPSVEDLVSMIEGTIGPITEPTTPRGLARRIAGKLPALLAKLQAERARFSPETGPKRSPGPDPENHSSNDPTS